MQKSGAKCLEMRLGQRWDDFWNLDCTVTMINWSFSTVVAPKETQVFGTEILRRTEFRPAGCSLSYTGGRFGSGVAGVDARPALKISCWSRSHWAISHNTASSQQFPIRPEGVIVETPCGRR